MLHSSPLNLFRTESPFRVDLEDGEDVGGGGQGGLPARCVVRAAHDDDDIMLMWEGAKKRRSPYAKC
jgi:hypothetical protein